MIDKKSFYIRRFSICAEPMFTCFSREIWYDSTLRIRWICTQVMINVSFPVQILYSNLSACSRSLCWLSSHIERNNSGLNFYVISSLLCKWGFSCLIHYIFLIGIYSYPIDVEYRSKFTWEELKAKNKPVSVFCPKRLLLQMVAIFLCLLSLVCIK